jgi:ABC-2 type transport system ATP-binding protein
VGTQKELTRLVGEQETLRLHLGEGDDSEKTAEMLQSLESVVLAGAVNGEVVLTVEEAATALPSIVSAANEANIRIRSIDIQEPNLEAVFLHLTGRALRD